MTPILRDLICLFGLTSAPIGFAGRGTIRREGLSSFGGEDSATKKQKFIRGFFETTFEKSTAESIRIQYGGSVNPGNSKILMAQKDIDGALVGSASLDAESFIAIINSAE